MRGAVRNVLQWFAGFRATFKKPTECVSRPIPPVSDIAGEAAPERAAGGAVANTTVPESATVSNADVKIGGALPDQQEIQRRRDLIRVLFNEFWNGQDDKPAAFVDRLDRAETYLNERLAGCGELWQLDADARKMLGLPPRILS
jgi:hypothetical protein